MQRTLVSNCYNSPYMTESNASPSALPDPTPPLPARHAWLNVALLVGVLALGIALASWFYSYRQAESLNQELAKRLTAFDNRSMESRTLASQAEETSRALSVKIGVLEQKLADSQDQQIALETLYQELARGRDETIVAEIEQLLLSASNELQLSANVKAALIALQAADSRLTRLDRPQLFPLRKAIGKDIERLRAAPFVDLPGITLKLDSLIDLAGTLSLLPGKPAAVKPAVAETNASAKNWWQRFLHEAWEDLSQLVQIQDMGKAEMPLLAPEQAYFARENVRLRLLSARLSLLAHDDKIFKSDIKTAQDWMRRFYNTKDLSVKAALQTLEQLSTSETRVDIPDITASLQALHALKLPSERGSR